MKSQSQALHTPVSFPPDYRKEDIATIRETVDTHKSLQVGGVPGIGISNLLEHFERQADVSGRSIFVNALSPERPRCRGRTIRKRRSGNMPSSLDREYVSVLSELVEDLRTATTSPIVIIIDGIGRFGSFPHADFFESLKALRDEERPTGLSFVFGVQRPRLQTRECFGELWELMANPLWIKPLHSRDVKFAIDREEGRLHTSFTPKQVRRLSRASGGHPGLLKIACGLIAEAADGSVPVTDTRFEGECETIWKEFLTFEEKRTLVSGRKQNQLQQEAATLIKAGLMKPDGQPFSTIFGKYVSSRPLSDIAKDSAEHYWRGFATPLNLTAQPRTLLEFFLHQERELITLDDVRQLFQSPSLKPQALIDRVRTQLESLLDQINGISAVERNPTAQVHHLAATVQGYLKLWDAKPASPDQANQALSRFRGALCPANHEKPDDCNRQCPGYEFYLEGSGPYRFLQPSETGKVWRAFVRAPALKGLTLGAPALPTRIAD